MIWVMDVNHCLAKPRKENHLDYQAVTTSHAKGKTGHPYGGPQVRMSKTFLEILLESPPAVQEAQEFTVRQHMSWHRELDVEEVREHTQLTETQRAYSKKGQPNKFKPEVVAQMPGEFLTILKWKMRAASSCRLIEEFGAILASSGGQEIVEFVLELVPLGTQRLSRALVDAVATYNAKPEG